MITREEIVANVNPNCHGVRLIEDSHLPYANGFSDIQLAQAYYHATAISNDAALITESASFEEIDEFYNPGTEIIPDFILEAIAVARFAQTERRMKAVTRVLDRHLRGNEDEISTLDPVIGKPRRSAGFAYVTVLFPFSDGQSITIVFHSPGGDKKKIDPDDSIIAFRWLLNNRDITHIVAPEQGADVSLTDIGKKMVQMLVKNHAKFVARQKTVVAEKEELQNLTDQTTELANSVDEKEKKLEETSSEDTLLAAYEETLDEKISSQQIHNAEVEAEITALKARLKKRQGGVDEIYKKMVATAKRWRDAAYKVAVALKDDTKKQLALSNITTKSDMDKYLMKRYQVDSITARSVSNQLTSDNYQPQPENADLAEFKDEAWAKMMPGADSKWPKTSTFLKLQTEADGMVATLYGIQTGELRGYDASLFRQSFVGKVKRAINNGFKDDAAASLEYLKSIEPKYLDKPALAARNAIWKLAGVEPGKFRKKKKGDDVGPGEHTYTVYKIELDNSLSNKEHLNSGKELDAWLLEKYGKFSNVRVIRDQDQNTVDYTDDGEKWVVAKKGKSNDINQFESDSRLKDLPQPIEIATLVGENKERYYEHAREKYIAVIEPAEVLIEQHTEKYIQSLSSSIIQESIRKFEDAKKALDDMNGFTELFAEQLIDSNQLAENYLARYNAYKDEYLKIKESDSSQKQVEAYDALQEQNQKINSLFSDIIELTGIRPHGLKDMTLEKVKKWLVTYVSGELKVGQNAKLRDLLSRRSDAAMHLVDIRMKLEKAAVSRLAEDEQHEKEPPVDPNTFTWIDGDQPARYATVYVMKDGQYVSARFHSMDGDEAVTSIDGIIWRVPKDQVFKEVPSDGTLAGTVEPEGEDVPNESFDKGPVDVLSAIVAGDYDTMPEELEKALDKAADELEEKGLMDEYDELLNKAADKAAEIAINAAKEVM